MVQPGRPEVGSFGKDRHSSRGGGGRVRENSAAGGGISIRRAAGSAVESAGQFGDRFRSALKGG